MLGLLELVQLGTAELKSLANSGEIRMKHVWVAAKGADKYRKAIADGDLRPTERALSCARRCAGCPSRTTRDIKVNGLDVSVGHCGPAFEEIPEGNRKGLPPTCGCLVSLTFAGQIYAAGKTIVGSERCPQGSWPE